MAITVNLRHLEAHNVKLEGELPVQELDIETHDEVIRLDSPVQYAIEVQKLEEGLLVEGRLNVDLSCDCVRCLKSFVQKLSLDPWTLHIPLVGEDAAPVNNDCVDLTPYMREDILLGFPQHPLCNAECRGLPEQSPGCAKETNKAGQDESDSSAWAELNKLKF